MPGAPTPPRPAGPPTGPTGPRALTSCSSMSTPRAERTKPRSGRSAATDAPAPCAGLLVRVLTLDGNSAIAASLASRGRAGRRRRPSARGGYRLLRRSSRGGTRLPAPPLPPLRAASRDGDWGRQVRPEPRARPRRGTRPFNPPLAAAGPACRRTKSRPLYRRGH